MGWYHSKQSNRLKYFKVLGLAQIRAHMQRQQQVQMIENELQEDQDDEVASFVNTYNISIHNIEQLQHPAIDSQAK
ncbi:unnamed protein product [Rhizophagus irregularis]|nr:unnamed protein product [Rhizophagus irregularis]